MKKNLFFKALLPILLLSTAQSTLLWGAADDAQKLFNAINRGKIDLVKPLVNKSTINAQTQPDPNSPRLYSGGDTPLHVAFNQLRRKARQDYADIAQYLIGQGNNANIANNGGATPLHILAGYIAPQANPVAREGRVEDPKEQDPTPLIASLANTLINKGAVQLDARDKAGKTPLAWATISGYPGLVATLIKAGADVNARDNDGKTPLMSAAQKGHLNIMLQLIRAGAKVNLQDVTKGRTALHWVQRMREGATIKSGRYMTKEHALKGMRLLLDRGADPTIKDKITKDNPTAHSTIDWANSEKTPWPQHDNKELKLLRSYIPAQQAREPQVQAQPRTQPAASSTSTQPAASPARRAQASSSTSSREKPSQTIPRIRAKIQNRQKLSQQDIALLQIIANNPNDPARAVLAKQFLSQSQQKQSQPSAQPSASPARRAQASSSTSSREKPSQTIPRIRAKIRNRQKLSQQDLALLQKIANNENDPTRAYLAKILLKKAKRQ